MYVTEGDRGEPDVLEATRTLRVMWVEKWIIRHFTLYTMPL